MGKLCMWWEIWDVVRDGGILIGNYEYGEECEAM